MFLGREPKNRFGVDWRKIRSKTLELMEREGLSYQPDTKLKELTVSDIQMLEILKAISYDSDIIIMDEPTSAITTREVAVLFRKIADLNAKGVSIIYISHKMEEIFRIADEITVLRDGSVVDTRPARELDIDTVIALMVGGKITNVYPKEEFPAGEKLLEVEALSHGRLFRNISFNVRAGEIVGLAGLMGAGGTEVAHAIFGLDPYTAGKIRIKGQTVKIRKVQDSIDHGMVMLSEDRKRYGIIPVRDVKENISLANLSQFKRKGCLHLKKELHTVKSICERIRLKTPGLDTTVDSLSGGNQQKVVLAKWMLRSPDIIILDEPTRGIDVGAKYEIYKLIIELVREQKAIIMISSELSEVLGMCDQIYVMAKGQIMGELGKDHHYCLWRNITDHHRSVGPFRRIRSSVGRLLSVASFKATNSLMLSMLVGIAIGVACNFINGMMVTKFSVPPFIATLAMMTAARGAALMFTNGQNIYQLGKFVIWGQSNIAIIPIPVVFMIGIALITWL